ncbi:hypothetical protein Hdeb2414_s0005g00163071 [Helianthus debilis subsp. tardiflorus]
MVKRGLVAVILDGVGGGGFSESASWRNKLRDVVAPVAKIRDEVSESDEERDKMLLQIEQECVDA